MQKIVQVHMLPTENKSDIVLCQNTDKLILRSADFFIIEADITFVNGKYQHLYFTSEEEIKEGDWCYHPEISQEYTILKGKEQSKGLHPAQGVFQWKDTTNEWYKKARKIVATTNPELWIHDSSDGITTFTGIKQIPLSFVKQYVEKQVKEVKIECEIEYEEIPRFNTWQSIDFKEIEKGLKLDSQGHVIISPIEEKMYTRGDRFDVAERIFLSFNSEQFNEIKMRNEYGREKGKAFKIWFDKNYPND